MDRLFVTMFDDLNENCKKELDAINRQYPFEPLKVKDMVFIKMIYIILLNN